MSILRLAARLPLWFASLSPFLIAPPALCATPVITLSSSTIGTGSSIASVSPSWHASAHLHRSADSLLGLGESAVANRGMASETSSWQQVPPGAGLDTATLTTPPPGFVAASSVLTAPPGSRGAGNPRMRLPHFETAAISQPGIYTMLLIGVGLLLLRMRRQDGQDEKFSA